MTRKQERSKAKVAAILTATTRILMRRGLDYFPNKETLIAALIERHTERHVKRVDACIAATKGKALDEAIPAVIQTVVEIFVRNRRLLRLIYEHSAGLNRTHVERMLQSLLEEYRDEIGEVEMEKVVFVTVNAVMGVMQAAIIGSPDFMSEEDFVRELSRMILGYLRAANSRA